MKVTINRAVEAEQWIEGGALPDGVHLSLPEIEWSAGRALIYFTYADLRPNNWLGAEKLPVPENPKSEILEGLIIYTPRDGEPYARKLLPFAFWKVKSESSVTRDHSAKFLDADDAAMTALFFDYAAAEQWPNPIPRRAEYREINGKYARGYRPHYLKSGDWLLREPSLDGPIISVVSDDKFQAMRAL